MATRRLTTTALAVVLSLTFATAPVMANPGNGNGGGGHGNSGGQGNGGNHGNGNSGNHGNGMSDTHGNKKSGLDNPGKSNKSVSDDVDARVSFDHARHLAVNYGLTGYESLPPGIAKNLARGKPLPPVLRRKPCQPPCWASSLTILAMNGAWSVTIWSGCAEYCDCDFHY